MRLTFFCLLFVSIGCSAAYAQNDSLSTKNNSNLNPVTTQRVYISPDSVAKENREQFIADSLALKFLRPDSARENQFIRKIFKDNLSNNYSFAYIPVKPKGVLKSGEVRTAREQWVIAAIIGLLMYIALLNLFLNKDIKRVIQSFYDKHALSQVDKEGGLINSWAFIGLFILFSLAFGLVLYQVTVYYNVAYDISGFQLFITLSLVISLLFTFKFLVLKFIGFVFDMNRLVSQYIAILNLTYFNIAFVLVSVAVCFSLLASQFIPWLLLFTVILIAIIFAWQYLRNSVNIISNFRFHKFYLFLYLCALEICPILILIKALNI
jgi:hypothetical protein